MRKLQQEGVSTSSPKLIKISASARATAAERRGLASEIRLHWKRVGVTATCGIACGLLVAAAIGRPALDNPLRNPGGTLTVAGDGFVQTSVRAEEFSRLETRNRRLEALVEVLRKRNQAISTPSPRP